MNFRKLKIFAVLSMFLDHVGHMLKSEISYAVAGVFADPNTQEIFYSISNAISYSWGIIGRMASVLFFFFIANGYAHTKNLKKYILRLVIFGVIAQIPHTLFTEESLVPLSEMQFNILFTLALGLFSIWCFEKLKMKSMLLAIISTTIICILADIGNLEYGYRAILFIMFFYYTKDLSKGKRALLGLLAVLFIHLQFGYKLLSHGIVEPRFLPSAIATLSMYIIGNYLAVLLTLFYNEKQGKVTTFLKYFFYAFYPAHLLILAIIQMTK